ncbi:MAG: dTMP kinase [Ahrensia sp.]|nr:dTMP kinase [Ahrensia sp.]
MSTAVKHPYKGYFITFEGGEGVGKSTQIKRLVDRLKSIGAPVTTSREPGGTPGAEAVRHVVLDKAAAQPFGPHLEAILFAAARLDHVEQVILPALTKGHIVIIDRFMDSTRVYQGESNDLAQDFVTSLERVAVKNIVPDLTIILDLNPAIGLSRAASRRAPNIEIDRFEGEHIAEHAARRKAFLKIAQDEPERCKVVDASGSEDVVAEAIWAIVKVAIQQRFGMQPALVSAKSKIPSARL